MSKGDIAKEYFLSGKNCCQAVVLAFSDELKMSNADLEKLSIGFGGGFARLRLICGAVSGANLVLSKILSDGKDKQKIYKIIQEACENIKNELKSIMCGELLNGVSDVNTSPIPEERTKEYYKKRPCADICKLCADVVEETIKKYK